MLRVVILDDEKMERSFMKKYIDWKDLGIEVAGEASNGIDGLEVCRRVMPDIILTDIKMPHMDGMEFSRRVKKLLPDVKIIFVSGYEDFDYARSAVDQNSFGYILKPFRVENVTDIIRKVTLRCRDENRKNHEREQLKKVLEENRTVLKESLIRELVDGEDIREDIWERIEFLGLNLARGSYSVMMAEIDGYEEIAAGLAQEDRQLLSLKVLEDIRQAVNAVCRGEVVKLSGKQMMAVLGFEVNDNEPVIIQKVYSLAEAIRSEVQSKHNISLTIGLSRISGNIGSLHSLYQEAKDAVKYKLYNLKGQVISINDVQTPSSGSRLDLRKIDAELLEYLRSGNDEKINQLLGEIFDRSLLVESVPEEYIQSICFSLASTAMRFLNEENCTFRDVFGDEAIVWNKLIRFETIADVKQWLKNVFGAIQETISNRKISKNRMIVDRVIRMVNERYSEDLTTREISRDIYLSPNYIGAIFKEEMGFGFLEYLTKVRMEKAVSMLKDPNMKVYEIARMVGYNNTPYFSTLFRDYTGLTPSEYRERM